MYMYSAVEFHPVQLRLRKEKKVSLFSFHFSLVHCDMVWIVYNVKNITRNFPLPFSTHLFYFLWFYGYMLMYSSRTRRKNSIQIVHIIFMKIPEKANEIPDAAI